MNTRKLFLVGCIAAFTSLHAQDKDKMKKMPVFFGCEQFSDNTDLKKCFNANIGTAIQHEIDFFSNIADYLHIGDTEAKLKFTISTEGKFINAGVDGINPIFNSFVWSSLVMVQNKMDELKLKIQPGINQKNQPMDIALSIPVKFKSEYSQQVYDQFPVDERVLFTIDFENEIIEIRMDKNNMLRTVGNNGEREFYLGKYSNLFELATVEPYATKINESYQSTYTFITKGKIEDKEYTIRMKNFFSNKPDDEVLIEVIREENNSWAEYFAYKTKEEFNQSKFAKLTYR